MANHQTEKHNLEVSKLCFEFFKHLTTVATVASLIEVALYQHLGLTMMGVSLLLSLVGMFLIPARAGEEKEFLQDSTLGWVRVLMFFTVFLFAIGLSVFITSAVGLGPISGYFIGALVGTPLGLLGLWTVFR
jgi:predicted membrane channel-forming protein YqfA (hemolysin III family)